MRLRWEAVAGATASGEGVALVCPLSPLPDLLLNVYLEAWVRDFRGPTGAPSLVRLRLSAKASLLRCALFRSHRQSTQRIATV